MPESIINTKKLRESAIHNWSTDILIIIVFQFPVKTLKQANTNVLSNFVDNIYAVKFK